MVWQRRTVGRRAYEASGFGSRSVSLALGKFAGEQVAQHVGDGLAALEGDDLDATAQLGCDVDRQPGGESGAVTASTRRYLGFLDPVLGGAGTCGEATLGGSPV